MVRKFGPYDYTVLVIILLISISIGFYHGIKAKYGHRIKAFLKKKFNKNSLDIELNEIGNEDINEGNKVNEYLTANKSMGAIPVALSLLATFFSSTSLLGFPAEIYTFGIQYWISVFGMMTPALLGAFIFGPMFAQLKVLSVFEYFQHRFESTTVRLLGVSFYLVRILIGMGIVIYGPSTTLSSLTNIDQNIAIAVIGLSATVYTSIGGIKAVIWSDVFQLIVIITPNSSFLFF